MTLRIFESVFYKSLIRACSFDNFLAASQNARSCGQTINHRALRICKKRIQKVLMLSPFILINISSLVLSDSYNETLFKSLHSVYVKRYWLMIFVFINGRWKKLTNTDLLECLWSIITLLSVWKFPILQPMLFSIHTHLNFSILWIVHSIDFRYMIKNK